MPKCWKCNSKIKFLTNGWKCPCCKQSGPPDRIADSHEEAKQINAPYIERR